MALLNALVLSLATVASALPARIKCRGSQLRDSYDFVIAGGGTAGLTVADRLTEAFPDSKSRLIAAVLPLTINQPPLRAIETVLVVEYGEIEYAPGIFDPPQIVWGGSSNGASTWAFESLPNPDVKNKTAVVLVGKVVGGSSAVNGMFFDRPSSFDFEAWHQAGSPEFDSSEDKWDWDGIFSYFKKARESTH
jgi:choline dehydrogenase-like flavoprotein